MNPNACNPNFFAVFEMKAAIADVGSGKVFTNHLGVSTFYNRCFLHRGVECLALLQSADCYEMGRRRLVEVLAGVLSRGTILFTPSIAFSDQVPQDTVC